MTIHPALEAVAELIRVQTMRIDYDGIPGLAHTLRAPSLLAQLATLTGIGTETGGRGVPGSRPTINPDAIDLWTEIVTATAHWCALLGVDRTALRAAPAPERVAVDPTGRRQQRAPWPLMLDEHVANVIRELPTTTQGRPTRSRLVDLAAPPEPNIETPAVGKLLRSCAADAISRGMPEVAERIRTSATSWTHRIEAMLGDPTEQRGIRGAGCPECTQVRPYPRGQIGPWAGPQPTTTVIEDREENGRQVAYRVPAIILVTREQLGETMRWLVCQACGWNRALDEAPAQAA